MVGSAALSSRRLLASHTPLADIAFIFPPGSALDVFFNANPLIKLDGYNFLSRSFRGLAAKANLTLQKP